MTLDNLITMFEDIAQGKLPKVGYHLHSDIRNIITALGGADKVAEFLRAVKEAEVPDA